MVKILHLVHSIMMSELIGSIVNVILIPPAILTFVKSLSSTGGTVLLDSCVTFLLSFLSIF